MDPKTVGIAALIALAYIVWPNLAKPLGIKPELVVFVIVLIAFVAYAFVGYQNIQELRALSMKAILIIFICGIANVAAIYFYADIAADKNTQTGIFLASVVILELIFAPLVDAIITGVKPSREQFAGLVLSLPVVWLLTQGPKSP